MSLNKTLSQSKKTYERHSNYTIIITILNEIN